MILDELKDFTVNSEPRLRAFCALVERAWEEHKFLTFSKPRIGEKRSLDQNALFHLWASQYAGYFLNKDYKQVTDGELDGCKRTLKSKCYNATGWDFLVLEIKDPISTRTRMDYQSTARLKVGEMFQFMEWIQNCAAGDGLVLESKGEFKHNQEKQNA